MTQSRGYILVTGGAGYIGAHMAALLLQGGHKVVVFDNLSTGRRSWVPSAAAFVQGDLLRQQDCQRLFKKYRVHTVMHFAGKIIIPESLANPALYYHHNVGGTLNLLAAMIGHGVKRMVFSSTAAVYGHPAKIPVTEKFPTAPANPYGLSKLMAEQILHDTARAGALEFIALRYFNVGGWDNSRRWACQGRPEPTHLIANVMSALSGKGILTVYGSNYKTFDGTGVRDFIHVLDLCRAHELAMNAFNKGIKNEIFNLGNGRGFSVKQVIRTAEQLTGRNIPHAVGPRRKGDIAAMVASSAKARRVLGWKPQLDLKSIVQSELSRLP